MKRIRVADLAQRDLDEIWYYIARQSQSIELANSVVESLIDCFALFAHTPEAGTRRDHIEPGLRGFPAGKYVISYHEIAEHVVVSRVIHGMRDQRTAYEGETG